MQGTGAGEGWPVGGGLVEPSGKSPVKGSAPEVRRRHDFELTRGPELWAWGGWPSLVLV